MFWLAQTAAGQPLKSERIMGRDYVPVANVAKHYGLGSVRSSSKERAEYRSATRRLIVEADSRQAFINGTPHWLSDPIANVRGQLWISSTDVLKAVDPVFRSGGSSKSGSLRTIMIDAGHGGADRGTRGTKSNEKDLTLDLSRRLEKLLVAEGIRVYQTRTSDVTLSLPNRVVLMEKRKPDLFVSLHFNSGGSATGIETYCLTPSGAVSTATSISRLRTSAAEWSSGNRHDPSNAWLAHCVQETLVDTTATVDRGVRRARFYVLRNAICPAILIEAGFLSNSTEERKILSSAYRDQLAKGIAEGILKYRKSTE